MCQSLGNPSKLVIYLFGTLLALSPTVSPRCLSSLVLYSFIFASSLSLSLQFSLVSHLLSRLPLSFRSQSVSLSLWTPVLFLSLLPVFFSFPCLPLTPKRYLCLSSFYSLSLTSLCSSRSLLLPHPPLLHFSHLFCPLFSSCHLLFSHLSSSCWLSLSLIFSLHPSFSVVFIFHTLPFSSQFLLLLLVLLFSDSLSSPFSFLFQFLHVSFLCFPPPLSVLHLSQIAFPLTFPSCSPSSTLFIFLLSARRAARLMAIFHSCTHSLLPSPIHPSIHPFALSPQSVEPPSSSPLTPRLALSSSLIPPSLFLRLLPPSSLHPPPPFRAQRKDAGWSRAFN